MNLLFLFHGGNLTPPPSPLLFLCLRSWNSPGNRTNKARQIVPSLVNPAEALSFSQFVSLIEELGNQVTAASVNGVFTVTGRSVNLQDCSCSRIVPPHILKNRRVSRRDTRLVSRSLLLRRYIYIYISLFLLFLSIFFALPPHLSASPRSARTEFLPRETTHQRPNYYPSFYVSNITATVCPEIFREHGRNLRAAKRPTRTLHSQRCSLHRKAKRKKKSVIKKKEPLVQSADKWNDISDRSIFTTTSQWNIVER